MKIAIPVNHGHVNEHFGHAEQYSVFTVSPENRIVGSEIIEANLGCGCRSGIAETLANKGVTLMLAGNIGAGAINHLYMNGIDVIRGCSGPAEDVLLAYLDGKVEDNNQVCHQHEGCDDENGHRHGQHQ